MLKLVIEGRNVLGVVELVPLAIKIRWFLSGVELRAHARRLASRAESTFLATKKTRVPTAASFHNAVEAP